MAEIMLEKMSVRNEIRAYIGWIVLSFIVQLHLLGRVCMSECLVGVDKDQESWNGSCQDEF